MNESNNSNICQNCKTMIKDGDAFCTGCGKKVEVQAALNSVIKVYECPKCKRKLPPGNTFCITCNQSVEVSNAIINNTEITCNNCGNVLKATDVYCTECGQKKTLIVYPSTSQSFAGTTHSSLLNPPTASIGKPLVVSGIFGFNLTEEQMVDEIIKKEIEKTGENSNISISGVEKRKNIFSIIYAIILFICVSLFFFHSHTFILICVFGVVTLIYFNSMKNYNLLKYLHKEVKARPDEKIGYIVSSVMAGKINNSSYKIMRIVAMLVAIVIPMFIFSSPHVIYEHDSELDGYVIRFYTIGWLENEKKLEIPAEYNNEPVVGIRGDVFANVKSLEKVILPDTIKEIRGGAFTNASNLEEINLPEGIPEIKGETFQGCSSLKSITIPDSVTRIGGHAFRENYDLKEVYISPNSKLTEIGSSAFRDCYELDEIYLPRDVYVNERAFKGSGTVIKEYYGEDGVVLEDVFEEKYSFRTSNYLNVEEEYMIDTYRSEVGIQDLFIKLEKIEYSNSENTFVIVVYNDEGLQTFSLDRDVPYKTLDDYGITVYIDSDYLFENYRSGATVLIYYN